MQTAMPTKTDVMITYKSELGIFPVFGSCFTSVSPTVSHESPEQLIKLPSRALVFSERPSLLFSTSKMPKKEVKKAPPN